MAKFINLDIAIINTDRVVMVRELKFWEEKAFRGEKRPQSVILIDVGKRVLEKWYCYFSVKQMNEILIAIEKG